MPGSPQVERVQEQKEDFFSRHGCVFFQFFQKRSERFCRPDLQKNIILSESYYSFEAAPVARWLPMRSSGLAPNSSGCRYLPLSSAFFSTSGTTRLAFA